ncbi:TauD/TfdA family dioxygenase [Micromonospora noduli]|uniref:TauD/TfdA family dioxygenase n=1 Tax=Micromonospora noduli TaxID=709876 RepID=UPI000DBF9942|nr:TauD/TfdA family dioxygenase [Micromonospora noduli]KAB1928233.1 TauD/TfdA family dioxygenase [Micromonospora noduli]RAO12520.1 Dapdiamide synthesis protein DdaC [Micromonospora noduli]
MTDDTQRRPVIRRRDPVRESVSVHREWHGATLPALVRARGLDVDLQQWIRDHSDTVDALAHAAGAVLFRGFPVTEAADFRRAMDALSNEVLGYGERSSPRSEVVSGVYTSTDHPPDEPIVLHNEQSYTLDWPMRIVFCCTIEPDADGRTPLADSRRVLARLRPDVVSKFTRTGIRYVRNYLPGISLSWQEAFQTERRDHVEDYCRAADIRWEWLGADHLRTTQVRAAVRTHPVTGEASWFNHALFFHVSSLPPEVSEELRTALPEEHLPYNTYYGDGQRIDDEVLAELRAAYDAETIAFDWRQGDVLLVENMLVAHGREPYRGRRRILAAMSDPYSSAGVPA